MTVTSDRCLVTGAGGFIGSHLVERLVREGARVRAFVHYGSRPGLGNLDLLPAEIRGSIEVVAGDVTDPTSIDAAVAGCDVVHHLAAIISIPHSMRSPQRCLSVNAGGTLEVIDACRRHGVRRLVHASTSEVYGSGQQVPMPESHPIVPQSPYAASKVASDALVEAARRSHGLPAVTIRPFNTYGPRQSTRAVLASIVAQLVAGAPELELGDLRPTRDFVHVEDTVAGFLAAASREAAVGGVFNLATGRETSIRDAASLAMQAVGRVVPIVERVDRTRPERSEVRRLVGDASAARAVLGWAPRIALEEGIRTIVEFVRRHPERCRPSEQIA